MSHRRILAGIAGALALAAAGVRAAPAPRDAGERLYLSGVTAAGSPLEGLVQGDVALGGAQASCASCHGRSGFGSAEGGRIAPAVTGAALRAPRERGPNPRPAYDSAGIARALRTGIGAGGRPLDPLMPRYRIGDADLAALLAHLDRISSAPVPGVSAKAIHLATVVTPGAPLAAREAALAVARAYVASQNEAARVERAGHPRGRYGEREFSGEWFVHPWILTGPPQGWPGQLAALQRRQPVFAVLGGAGGEWSLVDRFCEEQRIPCLLPNADAPPGGDGWYSRYFSRGPALEAEVMASRLAATGRPRVLQITRGAAGAAASRALAAALAARGLDIPVELALTGPPRLEPIAARAREAKATAAVLWLPAEDLAALRGAGRVLGLPLYVSATLAGDLAPARALEGEGWAIQPWAPEGDAAARFRSVSPWLASRGITASSDAARRWQDQAAFATRAFGQAFAHQETTFSREFLVETLDHTPGVAVLSSYYPRLEFGPGQRFVSKGCWVVPLAGGGAGEWMVP